MDVKNTKNTGLEKISINEEVYANLLKMLTSTKEDAIVAIECIKNLNLEENIIPVLYLLKNGNVSLKVWEENAPSVIKKVKSLLFLDSYSRIIIKHSDIYKILTKLKKNKKESVIFFKNRFNKDFKEHLENFIGISDFVKVDDLTLKFNIKDE